MENLEKKNWQPCLLAYFNSKSYQKPKLITLKKTQVLYVTKSVAFIFFYFKVILNIKIMIYKKDDKYFYKQNYSKKCH